jgi:hypothetical protein
MRSPDAGLRFERLSDTPSSAIDEAHPFVTAARAGLREDSAPDYDSFGTEPGHV